MTRDRWSERGVVLRNQILYWFTWLSVAGGFVGIFAGLGRSIPKAERWQAIQFSFALLLVIWVMWHAGAGTRIVIRSTSVEVVNVFRRHIIPWSAISETKVDGNIIFHLKDDRRVEAMAAGVSLLSALNGYRTQERICQVIEKARVAHQRDEPSGDSEVRSGWKLHFLPFVVVNSLLIAWIQFA